MQSGNPITIEAGAFADGPGLDPSSPPNMPVTGSASYQGAAAGMYAAEYGSDAGSLSGGAEVGKFSADATLNANFNDGTISGCCWLRISNQGHRDLLRFIRHSQYVRHDHDTPSEAGVREFRPNTRHLRGIERENHRRTNPGPSARAVAGAGSSRTGRVVEIRALLPVCLPAREQLLAAARPPS